MDRRNAHGQSVLPIESQTAELRLLLQEARQAQRLYLLLLHADAVNALALEPETRSPLFASGRTIAAALREFSKCWSRQIPLVVVEVEPTKLLLGFGKAHAEVEWTLTWENFKKVEVPRPDSSPEKTPRS